MGILLTSLIRKALKLLSSLQFHL